MTSDATDRQRGGAGVPRSIDRVLDIVETVISAGSISLTETATLNDLTPTTALRYLRALETRGYVHRGDDGSYSVGATLRRLTLSVADGSTLVHLVEMTRPILDELAATTGETTYLGISDGTAARYFAAAESRRAIRHTGGVGTILPLDGTAIGAALADPGTVATVRDAIEPDITAISIAISGDTAVSVVGPTHRLDDAVVAEISKQLAAATEPLRSTR